MIVKELICCFTIEQDGNNIFIKFLRNPTQF